MVRAGRVVAGKRTLTKPSQLVSLEEDVIITPGEEYVSRAGLKLKQAIDLFGIDVVGKTALDVGASTGGFTDVLLRHGAKHVVAIDVGHDQLAKSLRENSRVHFFEGINARDLKISQLRELCQDVKLSFDLVVADLSFISLTLVLPALSELSSNADFVLLIKPQFEVGKQSLSASGVVSDYRLRSQAIKQVVDCALGLGLEVQGLERSNLPGTHGNIEYLLWISSSKGIDRSILTQRIEELARESK